MSKLYYGWWIAANAFLVLFLTYGVQYSFGVFVPAMSDELGWDRRTLGGAFSVYTVVYTGFSLVSGRLTDTLGPRSVVALGGVLLGVGLVAASRVSAPWQLYLSYGLVAALGMSAAYIPCNITVVRWFRRRRGLALGLASCGASSGILLMPMLAAALIGAAGWRTALLVLGLALLVLLNIIALFMVRTPEQIGLLPDGDVPESTTQPVQTSATRDTPDWTLRGARGTLSFWLFVVAFALTLLTTTVPFVHLPLFALDLRMSGLSGAAAVSVVGLFALLGSLMLGALSDRIGRKGAMLTALAFQIIAFTLFLGTEQPSTLYLAAAAFGVFYGGMASLFPALVGDLFGRAHAGAIGGVVFGGAGLLGAWGPTIVGYLRDNAGDYRLAFTVCVFTAAVALTLFALLPRPRGTAS